MNDDNSSIRGHLSGLNKMHRASLHLCAPCEFPEPPKPENGSQRNWSNPEAAFCEWTVGCLGQNQLALPSASLSLWRRHW